MTQNSELEEEVHHTDYGVPPSHSGSSWLCWAGASTRIPSGYYRVGMKVEDQAEVVGQG